jgi:uncharacterized protein (TIGR00297 family)
LTLTFAFLGWISRGVDLTGAVAGGAVAFIFVGFGGWQFFLSLVLVFLLTIVATWVGHAQKEQLGLAESRKGRSASQVMANLGVCALLLVVASSETPFGLIFPALSAVAALAEAAADTVSSEIGEALGGRPFLISTMRRVKPGTDGGITLKGTLAGIVAAASVVACSAYFSHIGAGRMGWLVLAGVAGMFVDSWVGAVFERRGWLNNDGVNLLGSSSAAASAWLLLQVA